MNVVEENVFKPDSILCRTLKLGMLPDKGIWRGSLVRRCGVVGIAAGIRRSLKLKLDRSPKDIDQQLVHCHGRLGLCMRVTVIRWINMALCPRMVMGFVLRTKILEGFHIRGLHGMHPITLRPSTRGMLIIDQTFFYSSLHRYLNTQVRGQAIDVCKPSTNAQVDR